MLRSFDLPVPVEREKYVDEAFGLWFIMGEYPDGDVEIADIDQTIITKISREKAEQVMAARYEFMDKMYRILVKQGE